MWEGIGSIWELSILVFPGLKVHKKGFIQYILLSLNIILLRFIHGFESINSFFFIVQ